MDLLSHVIIQAGREGSHIPGIPSLTWQHLLYPKADQHPPTTPELGFKHHQKGTIRFSLRVVGGSRKVQSRALLTISSEYI